MQFWTLKRNKSITSASTSSSLFSLLPFLAFLFGLFHLFTSIVVQSGTYDEYNHYSWSEALVLKSELLPRTSGHISTTPVIILNVLSGEFLKDSTFVKLISSYYKVDGNWWPKRVPGVFWYSILVFCTYHLALQVGGLSVARAAAIATALTPSLIGHGSVVTVDLPYAAIVTCLTYYSVLVFRELTLFRALAVAIFVGLAFITKFTAVLLVPYLFVLVLALVLKAFYSDFRILNLLWVSLVFCVLPYVSALVIDSAYLFIDIRHWTSQYQLSSPLLSKIFQALPDLYLPLPQSFISGIDACLNTERGGTWNVILLDKFYPKGSIWYFPLNYLFKTPSVIIFMTLVGIVSYFYNFIFKQSFLVLFQVLFGAIYFLFFFSTQVGLRYVIFLLPLFYILSYIGLFRTLGRRGLLLGTVLLCLESLLTFGYFTGYFLSYFNSVFVSSKKPFLYVVDSNFDWGQTNSVFWNSNLARGPVDPDILQPGLNTFSTNRLAGVLWDFPRKAWIRRNLEPVETKALTFFVYDVSDTEFLSYLESEHLLVSNPKITERCAVQDKVQLLSQVNYLLPRNNTEVVCLNIENEAVISIAKSATTLNGLMDASSISRVGALMPSGDCDYFELHDDQRAWFRVERGIHGLCLRGGFEYFVSVEERFSKLIRQKVP